MSCEYFLEMKNITKTFHGVYALKDVELHVKSGEIRALIGENGAGKSTLMKILDGLYTADTGEILIEGEQVDIKSPMDARKYGINFMHQEICLAENMTIAENLYLGLETTKGLFIDKKEMLRLTQKHLDELELGLKADMLVQKLSLAQQQMVEIARALFFDAKLVVMDEPTSSLTNKEVESLFLHIEKLKKRNISVIYISHRMEELFRVADTVTVLRDGMYIGTKRICEITNESLISMMVGRKLEHAASVRMKGSDTIFEVKDLKNKYLKNISFELKRGEILGFAGLVGAGRTEMAKAIYGIDSLEKGTILLQGKEIKNSSAKDAIDHGIVLIPEDRKRYGLITMLDVGFNLTLAVLNEFIKGCMVNRKKEKKIIDQYSTALSIKMASRKQVCAGLSGGNQQKVVISKWLAVNPKVIIMDEPTRGIDVGAKSEIYDLIFKLAREGIAIIIISSELPEILRLSSRIAVMHEGELSVILDAVNQEVTQEQIMYFATGGK